VRDARELSMTKTVNEAGGVTIRLRNEYSAPATAWIVECHKPASGGWASQWHWSDTSLGLDPKPLDPGKETDFAVPKAMITRTCDDFHVIAAVFADGTVSGDRSWITAIVDERRRVYQDIAKAIDMLNKSVNDGADRSAVVKQFTEWRDAELPNPGRVPKTYGETLGFNPQSPKPFIPTRPFARAAVPGLTVLLLQEQANAIPDAVKALQEWRERLGQIKLVTEAGGPTSPPETRPRQQAQSARPADPDLIGKPAPDFTLKDLDGREIALKDLRGKAVLLNFWGSWCPPCREELPQLEALYKALKDKGQVVIGIDST